MARKKDPEFGPAIHRARYERLTIYEITDGELDELERGSPDSILLNFSIFCLSVFLSFLMALLTTKIESIYTFIVFVVVTVVGALAGFLLLILWFRSRSSTGSVIQRIKDRLPPEQGIQEPPALINNIEDQQEA